MEGLRHVIKKSGGPFLGSCLFLFLIHCNTQPTRMPASSSIKGIVKDSSGQPISDAVVMIVDGPYEFPDIAAITNDEGVFHLSNIRVPGTYTLQVNGNDRMIKKEFSLKGNDSIEVVF